MSVKDNSQERKHPPFSLSWISISKGHNEGLYSCSQNLGNPRTGAACTTPVCKPRCGFGVMCPLSPRVQDRLVLRMGLGAQVSPGCFPTGACSVCCEVERAVGMQLGRGGCPSSAAWMVLPKALWAWEGRLTQPCAWG